MKLCVFQGTFNPIHNAHLGAAKYIIEKLHYDKVIFIPAFRPPHKDYKESYSIHRLNMVKLAVEGNSHFIVSDIEFKRCDTSYTYTTICELHNTFSVDGKIKFIIGTDAFKRIETWYKADELKKLVDFIVFIRENNFNPEEFRNLKEKGYSFEFMPMEFNDISSTEIRERIKAGRSVTGLVPEKVEEYIKENELYKD